MRRLPRISKKCAICDQSFEVPPYNASAIATCSKPCSLQYRSKNAKGRKVTWGDKIGEALSGRKCPWSAYPENVERRVKTRIQNGKPSHWKGKKLSEETKAKMSMSRTGKTSGGWKLSTATREKMSEARKGEKTNFWKGGVTKEGVLIRSGFRYALWRKSVFERDDYTCQVCHKRGCALQAHHILPFATHPEKRFDVSNGQTLCVDCHKETDTYLGKSRWNK